MSSPASAPVTVESSGFDYIGVKLTAAERKFVERQSRAELRTLSNYMRSLIVEKMSEK
jgi:hypothetical protein